MKKLFTLLFVTVFCLGLFGQEEMSENDLYLTFEWMEVDEENMWDYMEVEEFWEGIHKQRAAAGEILGWDLWSLLPGGSKQGAQFLVVTLYSSFGNMMKSGESNIWKHIKTAYPDLSEDEIMEKFEMTSQSRDLAWRVFLKQIDSSKDSFDMPIGTVAAMVAMMEKDKRYEKAEAKIFKPWHQKQIEAGKKGSWGFLKVLLPSGTDSYASHVAVDMYKDMDQYANFAYADGMMEMVTSLGIEEALKMREMKSINVATLIRKVRPEHK